MIKVRVDDVSGASDMGAVTAVFTSDLDWEADEVGDFLEELPSFCYVGDDAEAAGSIAESLRALGVAVTVQGGSGDAAADSEDEEEGESIRVYGNMAWFSPAEQPDSLDILPDDFAEARQLWEQDAEKNFDEVVELLSPYLGAMFVATNLEGWEEYFSDDSDGEFFPDEINLVGVEFREGPLPVCKAEAWFDVELKPGKSKSDVEEWIDNDHEGGLYAAISFGWEIMDDDLDELDLTFAENMGAEANIE
jgi:hypothetical protein